LNIKGRDASECKDDFAVGIDLGTTYSSVAVYRRDKEILIVRDEQGKRTIPSTVCFENTKDKENRFVGVVRAPIKRGEQSYVIGVKRLMGRRRTPDDVNQLPYSVETDGNQLQIKTGEGHAYSPDEISAMILSRLKTLTEKALGGVKVKDVVITVPAYFNDAQRKATKRAGMLAGLRVTRIINEPTAAAIAYGLRQEAKVGDDADIENNVVVFDLGGGTFDVSCVTIDDSVYEVVALAGDTRLGGQDFDTRLVEYCRSKFEIKDANPTDLKLWQLRMSAERAKWKLSEREQAVVAVKNFYQGKDLVVTLTRDIFESLCSELFRTCLTCLESVLIDAHLTKKEVSAVILVGGSTRIPKLREIIGDWFGRPPSRDVDPITAVCEGAAIQAGILQGLITNKDLTHVTLLDITPLSLGLDVAGGIMEVLVRRNSKIPLEVTKTFSTSRDNQEKLEICVFEGERAYCKDNNLLGVFELDLNDKESMKGKPEITVTFRIDVNGILTVQAMEVSSGKTATCVLTAQKQLSKKHREIIFRDVEKHMVEDNNARKVYSIKEDFAAFVTSIIGKLEEMHRKDKNRKDTKGVLGFCEEAHKFIQNVNISEKGAYELIESKWKEFELNLNVQVPELELEKH